MCQKYAKKMCVKVHNCQDNAQIKFVEVWMSNKFKY